MEKRYDNKYTFIRHLGSGGYGTVFLAKENVSNRLVAIKKLRKSGARSLAPIIREMQAVSKFNHPHIVSYYTHFIEEEDLFLVMEYCKQGSLRDVMKEKKLEETQILKWMIELTACLRDVHKKNIIHCDIKPENILVTADGTIKLSDFGIANTNLRTIAYWSPDEIEEDSPTSPRTDIYALGVTLMELLSGKNPFSGLSQEEIINKHRTQNYKITKLPQWQQDLILKAIHPVPEHRFKYMAEFKEALEARSVPMIFDGEGLKAVKYVLQSEKAMKTKKWREALNHLERAQQLFPVNVQVLESLGRYYLKTQHIKEAKMCIDKACKLNPRLNLQKELGWIHLELGNYPLAISLLSDHLHRQAEDLEAYNLLLACYYESGRYELGIELATVLLKNYRKNFCFMNNKFICELMLDPLAPVPEKEMAVNAFLKYNYTVATENPKSYGREKPSLKSKLLFMDWQFEEFEAGIISVLESSDEIVKPRTYRVNILTIGRMGYENDLLIDMGTKVSRRHCVIVNQHKSVWVYDLDSTVGTFLNGERVHKKAPIIGLNTLKIGPLDITVTTDSTKLL